MRWTRAASLTNGAACGRQSRVVLAPRRWCQVRETQVSRATVAKSPAHRGEHEISRKTIARGMPGDSGEPVVTMLVCLFYHLHTRLRVHWASGIPCALLLSEGRTALAQLGRIRAAGMRSLATSLRGALATTRRRSRGPGVRRNAFARRRKQSGFVIAARHWIASLALAMTIIGCLKIESRKCPTATGSRNIADRARPDGRARHRAQLQTSTVRYRQPFFVWTRCRARWQPPSS